MDGDLEAHPTQFGLVDDGFGPSALATYAGDIAGLVSPLADELLGREASVNAMPSVPASGVQG
ncbi:MAG: hypothetical protein OES57_08415 [Acidimicrobiia bacterium]|nr:hypothetical protein [Acidimicrobiia bacterium]